MNRFRNSGSQFGESPGCISPPVIVETNSCSGLLASIDIDWFGEVGALRIGCIDGLDRDDTVFNKSQSTLDLETEKIKLVRYYTGKWNSRLRQQGQAPR